MTSLSREIILTSSPDPPITAYDAVTGTALSRFSGSHSPRHGLTLAGPAVIAASHVPPTAPSSGSIHLYNWWSSAAFQSIPVPEPVAPIVATADGSFVFSGGLSGCVHTFALPSGDLQCSYCAHGCPVSCLAIDEDGSLLVSAGEDGTISIFPILRIFDTSSDCIALHQFSAHDSVITGIALTPGGCNCAVVSSSLDGTCKFWNMASSAHLRTVRFACEVWCVVVDPTNTAAYAGGSDGRVHVIPIRSEQRKSKAEVVAWGEEQSRAVTAIAMANANRNLVSASEDGIVRVWEVESGTVVRIFGQEQVCGYSNLSVAKGICSNRIRNVRAGSNLQTNWGFSQREICRKDGKVEEMEEKLNAVVKDNRRATEMLEVAIGTYENLMSFLLKGAKDHGNATKYEQSRI